MNSQRLYHHQSAHESVTENIGETHVGHQMMRGKMELPLWVLSLLNEYILKQNLKGQTWREKHQGVQTVNVSSCWKEGDRGEKEMLFDAGWHVQQWMSTGSIVT